MLELWGLGDRAVGYRKWIGQWTVSIFGETASVSHSATNRQGSPPTRLPTLTGTAPLRACLVSSTNSLRVDGGALRVIQDRQYHVDRALELFHGRGRANCTPCSVRVA